jgi:Zn-dependent peptidase ImmA (M78 family)/DNA-binding XRE family transcriptional regulator
VFVVKGWETLGARLRQAREDAELTQDDVAGYLDISRPAVSQIEGGRNRVDSLTLRRLATLYHRAMESFFDEQPTGPDIGDRLFETVGALSVHDRGTLTQFLEFCTSLGSLRKLLGKPPSRVIGTKPVSPRARKYAAEALAVEERGLLGLGQAPVGEALFDLLEAVGIPVYRSPMEDSRISGLLVNHPDAGAVIFVNSRQYRWRQVFTAAHEFGHFLVHQTEQPVACRIFERERRRGEGTGEEFVNAFASQFLMPSDGIKQALIEMGAGSEKLAVEDIIRLQRRFGVSFQAMLYRLLRLRLISESDVEALKQDVKPVSLAWHLGYSVEPDEFGATDEDDFDPAKKFPREFISLVLEAFERREISNGRAAEMLEMNRGAFDGFYRVLSHAKTPEEEGLENVVV